MVGMDQVVCQECAEVFLLMNRWFTIVWCSVFDRGAGEPVGKLERRKVLSPLANRPKLSRMDKYCCVKFCAAGNYARTA